MAGNPEVASWTQVHEFKPNEQLALETRGILVVLLSTLSQLDDATTLWGGGVKTIAAGREALTNFEKGFYSSESESVLTSLQRAFEENILHLGENNQTPLGFEASAVVLVNEFVYVLVFGGALAYIQRGGTLVPLAQSQKGESVVVSGKIEPEDTLLIGTSEFFKLFTPGVLKASLGSASAETASELLAPTVMKSQKQSSIAGVILRFVEDDSEVYPSEGIVHLKEVSKPSFALKLRLARVVDGILSRLPESGIFVQRQTLEGGDSKVKKKAAIIGIALIFVLLVSVVFGSKRRSFLSERSKYEARLQTAAHELEEAKSIKDLNASRARSLLLNSLQTVAELEKEGIEDPSLKELKEQLDNSLSEIAGVYKQTPELFLDLSLISSGFKVDEVVASAEKMLVLDKAGKRVVSIELDNKKTEVVGGPKEVEGSWGVGIYTDYSYLIGGFGIKELESSKVVVNKDWGDNSLIFLYAGNLYVLDKQNNSIWRYPGNGSSFGGKSSWLSTDLKVDLSQTRSWIIDGNIWVLEQTGEIDKYSLGREEIFTLNGANSSIKPVALYTDEELEDIYVLNEEGHVFVFNKKGDYKAEYVTDGIENIKKLIVSKETKKIIVFTDSKLYSLELKH